MNHRRDRVLIHSILVVCALFILMPYSVVHATDASTVTALIYNDSVTLGLSDNPDDLRSFGMESMYRHRSGWEFSTSIFALTYRDRSEDEDESGRYDELFLQGGKLFHFHFSDKDPHMRVDLTPFFGLSLMGNLGLEDVQNLVHRIFSIESVHLEYDISELAVLPYAGAKASFVYTEPAPWFSVSDMVFHAYAEVYHSFLFTSRVSAGVAIGQATPAVSEIMIGLGYTWAHAYDGGGITHERVTMSETGLTGSLNGNFGVFAFSYTWYLDRLQGYGGLGFSLGLDSDVSWTRSDILLSLGMTLPRGILATTLRYRLIKDFGITVTNMYKMAPYDDGGRTREILSQWVIGGDYEIRQLELGWMRPFAGLGMGVRRFLIMKDADESTIDSNGRVRDFSAVRVVADATVGLRFFPEGQITFQGVAYGVELSGGLQYSDMNGVEHLILAEGWTPYIRFRFTAGGRL